jgi:hypothetical protein
MMNRTHFILLALLSVPLFFTPAYADHLMNHYTPESQQQRCNDQLGRDCFCWEIGKCEFASDPYGVMTMPFDEVFGGLALVIFWSVIIGILWLRTENPMLVGMIGTAMTATYLASLETMADVPAEFDQARIIGGVLFAVSLGFTLYHIIQSKILSPPQ